MASARVAQRLSFAKIPEVQPLPDLLATQHESFNWFLETGLQELFDEISPIEDFTGTLALELTNHRFEEPTLAIEEAKERDSNYSRPLFVTARFMNRQTGEIKEQQVFLGDFPMMTPNGTFIINGTERVVVSQLVRSPGVYFDQTLDKTSDSRRLRRQGDPGTGCLARVRHRQEEHGRACGWTASGASYLTTFLRALDFAQSDEEMLALFDGAESIKETLDKDPDRRIATRPCSTCTASCAPAS